MVIRIEPGWTNLKLHEARAESSEIFATNMVGGSN
jgi:hypothetical protein